LSMVAMLFLIKIGTPWRGLAGVSCALNASHPVEPYPRIVPFARSLSSWAAIANASGLTSVTA